MRSKLRLCKFDLDFVFCAEEIRARNIAENERVHFILGIHCKGNAQHWLFETWMPQVWESQHRFRHYDGNIIHVIPKGIQSKTALLFSVLVSGIGKSNTSMWALGRLEWLAMELMVHAKHVAETSNSQAIQNF